MDIQVFDLRRMFLGDLPWTFLAEVAFRTAFLFAFTFVLIRLMSRRATGELSILEVLLIVALGSAVGDPMFYEDVPLVHGMVVIGTVVLLNQTFAAIMGRSERFKTLTEGEPARAVAAGRVDLDGMTHTGIALDELFEMLRTKDVEHLGQVRAAYIEPNGLVSVFRYPAADERRGLEIEPPDRLAPARRYREGELADREGYYACSQCGEVAHFQAGQRVVGCEHGHIAWVMRVGGPGATTRL